MIPGRRVEVGIEGSILWLELMDLGAIWSHEFEFRVRSGKTYDATFVKGAPKRDWNKWADLCLCNQLSNVLLKSLRGV